jgi:hypothetical protein
MEAIENLPYRFAAYPSAYYGAFIGFRNDARDPLTFCSCQKKAILTCLALWPPGIHSDRINRTGLAVPDCDDFPDEFWRPLMKADVSTNEEMEAHFTFHERLCHECNQRVPGYRPFNETNTSPFTTAFRWYIRKKGFENGIDLNSGLILEDDCCDELREIIRTEPLLAWNSRRAWKDHWKSILAHAEAWNRQKRFLTEFIQDRTRDAFGFPTRGAKLTSETILYLLAKGAFPNFKISRHYRPRALKGMSLDIFIHELSVGIEYQGDQHFTALEHWGGEQALKQTIERDRRKKEICDQLGIRLVYFDNNILDVHESTLRRAVAAAMTDISKQSAKSNHSVDRID